MVLELEQLTPVIGSEIRSINLNQVDTAMAAKIKTALNERLVLVFRDQSLTGKPANEAQCYWCEQNGRRAQRISGARTRPRYCRKKLPPDGRRGSQWQQHPHATQWRVVP